MCLVTGLTKDEVEEAIRLSGTAADEVKIIKNKKLQVVFKIPPVLNLSSRALFLYLHSLI